MFFFLFLSSFVTYGIDLENSILEKTFVSTDRDLYLTGEKIFCKVLVLDLNTKKYSDLSKVVYVELANKKEGSIIQQSVAIEAGKGFGVYAIPNDARSGIYTLRAYTNWMKNNELPTVFEKDITIVNPFNPVAFISKNENIYVSFYPEGGKLLENYEARVGFRFFGLDSIRRNVLAKVVDENYEVIASFSPGEFGIGSFNILCKADKKYETHIFIDESLYKTQGFSPINREGVTLEYTEPGKLIVINTLKKKTQGFNLQYIYNTKVIEKKDLTFKAGINNISIEEYKSFSGIHYFLLFDINDSLVSYTTHYTEAASDYNLSVIPDKNVYKIREKISVKVEIPDGADVKQTEFWAGIFYDDQKDRMNWENVSAHLVFNNGLLIHPDYSLLSRIMNNEDLCNNYLLSVGVKNQNSEAANNELFVPEVFGNVIWGTVFSKKDDKQISGQHVTLAVVGKKAYIHTTVSNEKGEYYFNLPTSVNIDEIVITLNKPDEDLYILPGEDYAKNFSTYEAPFLLDINQKKYLERMMVNLQVSKNFDSISLPEIICQDTLLPFYDYPDEVVEISEYVELPNMHEILFELSKKVVLGMESGNPTILISDNITNKPIGKNPLYLIDGIPVQQASDILQLNPADIKNINIVATKYFFEEQVYDGILDVVTKSGIYPGFEVSPTAIRQEYKNPSLPIRYQWPNYEKNCNSRIPDYRNTLFFDPEIKNDEDGKIKIKFYSPDNVGQYRIVIRGLSLKTNSFSGSSVFFVK